MSKFFEVMHNRMEELLELKTGYPWDAIHLEKRQRRSGPTISILHVEDSPFDTKWFQAVLAKTNLLDTFEIVHTRTLSKALKLLKRKDFDLVVTDLVLPDSANGETVRRITKKFPFIPTVVLTSSDEPETAVECIQNGARDYFVKSRTKGEDLARSMRFAMMPPRAA